MADNEAEDSSSKEDKVEKGKSGLKEKLLSKPMLIKIGAALLVVLLSAGGYFFMAGAEEPPEAALTEDVSDEDTEQEEPDEENIDEDSDSTDEMIELDLPEGMADDVDDISSIEESVELSEVTEEELVEEENTAQEDEESAAVALKQKETEAELSKVFKKATELKSENSRLQQQINELKAAAKRKEAYADPAVKAEASKYIVNRHRTEYGSSPSLREKKQDPPPEPKWGEFNKITK